MKYEPHPYQAYAERFLLEHDEAGLFLDMGLGKTVITLTAARKLAWDWDRLLVIAPKRPAVDTWPLEIRKWDHLRDLEYRVAVGSKDEREAAVLDQAPVTIINRENVPWLVEFWKSRWPYDFVVIDELSSFKSQRAQRFKALRRVRKKIRRIWGLTGTPAANGYTDLWAEAFLLDGGKALGRTLTGYRDQWFTPGRRNGNIVYEWKLRPFAEEEIQERLKVFCVSMKSEDWLQLPPFTTIEKPYTLSPDGRDRYRQMERDRLLEIEGEEIDAVNAAVLTGKLLQLSTGQIYRDDGRVATVHQDKLEAFRNLRDELAGENLLVFYQYRHERDRLLRDFPEAEEIKGPSSIERWRKGEIPILLAHPQSAGHGLNLQDGGRISVWYSLPTSLEQYEQAVRRLYRQGQTKPVMNFVFLGEDTYEERVWRIILQNKQERQEALLNALKKRQSEVLNENQT